MLFRVDYTIKSCTVGIVDYAFYGCTGLTNITIPDSVMTIGEEVFYDCTSLESITIPVSVTSIGGSAFNGCTSLSEITFEGDSPSFKTDGTGKQMTFEGVTATALLS